MLTALQRCMLMGHSSFTRTHCWLYRRDLHVRHAVAAAGQPATGPLVVPRIPSSWMLTLEHPIASLKQLDRQLAAAAPFSAEVHPDLPIATTWQGLMRALREGRISGPAVAATAAAAADLPSWEQQHQIAGPRGGKRMRVTSIGVQLRNEEECIARVCAAAGVTPQGQPLGGTAPSGDALLIVSGSHPVRQLPYMHKLLYNSVHLLHAATRLKKQGVLPSDLQLWAVANPVTEPSAALAAAKVAAGAQVLLTQPPLDWPAFQRWMADAVDRGLHEQVQLLIGYPCLSGAANVTFWGALCGAPNNPQVKELAAAFAAAERAEGGAPGGSYLDMSWCWNLGLLQQLLEVPGVGGLHFMPLTAGAKRIAIDIMRQQPQHLDAVHNTQQPEKQQQEQTTSSSSSSSSGGDVRPG